MIQPGNGPPNRNRSPMRGMSSTVVKLQSRHQEEIDCLRKGTSVGLVGWSYDGVMRPEWKDGRLMADFMIYEMNRIRT